MTVSLLSPGDEESWTSFVLAHPSATIYHTLEWRDVTQTLHHRPFYLIAKEGRGQVQGVLPLLYISGIRGRRLVSVPLRDRGGPLSQSAFATKELLEAAASLAREKRCRYAIIKTAESLLPVFEPLGFVQKTHYLTTVVPLDSEVKKMWSRLDSGSVRWAVRKAEKSGMSMVWGEGLADVLSFYRVFLRTRRKLGVPPYSASLFKTIWDKLTQSGKARFLLAKHHNRVIGGLVLFPFNDRVIEAYAASDERYLNLSTNDLMVWRAIEWAAKEGYRYFDFGASSPHQRGLRCFKLKWGGYEVALPYYLYLNRSGAAPILDSNASNYQAFRSLWRNVPAPLARAIGPCVTRQLD